MIGTRCNDMWILDDSLSWSYHAELEQGMLLLKTKCGVIHFQPGEELEELIAILKHYNETGELMEVKP